MVPKTTDTVVNNAIDNHIDEMEINNESTGTALSGTSDTESTEDANAEFHSAETKKGVLSFFWDLASVDNNSRVVSAHGLINALSDAQAAIEGSDVVVCGELDYCVKRLVRGVASSRLAARQGFVVALTEVLMSFPVIKISDVMKQMDVSLAVSGGMKGQESRDNMFGQVFGYSALLRSGRCSSEEVQRIVELIMSLSTQKTYLKPACAYIIVSAIKESPSKSHFETVILPKLLPAFAQEKWSVETLAFALSTQRAHPDMDYATLFKGWKDPYLLHQSNFSHLQSVLVQSTEVTQSGIHYIWKVLLDELLSEDGIAAKSKKIDFEMFWRVVVDEGLLRSSSHDRKFIGLQLFNEIVPGVPTKLVACMMTPTLMRMLINNLSKKESYLHNAALAAVTTMRAVGATDAMKAALFVSALQGPNGHRNFDQLSGFNVVDSLVSGLTAEGINAYLDYLTKAFLDPPPPVDQVDDVEAIDDSANAGHGNARDHGSHHELERHMNIYREWIINQMLGLCRNKRVPRTEQWVMRVIRFVMLHSFFEVSVPRTTISVPTTTPAKKSSKKSKKTLAAKFPSELLALVPELALGGGSPALSSATRDSCGKRLIALLTEVIAWPHLDENESNANRKEQNKATDGTMLDGEFWAHRINEATLALYNFAQTDEEKHLIVYGEDQSMPDVLSEKRRVMGVASAAVNRVRLVEASHETRKMTINHTHKHARALELLLVHASLLLMSGEGEAVDAIEDLAKCVEKEFSESVTAPKTPGRTPRKSKKAPVEEDDGTPAVIEVLTDTLLSLLAKPVSILRTVTVHVFKVYCSDMTPGALDLLLQVLLMTPGTAETDDILMAEESGSEHDDESDSDNENESEESKISSNKKIDSDSEEDSDSDLSEEEDIKMDENIKRDVKAALGDAAVDMDADSGSELSDYDDEQMAAFDTKLSEVFKTKKSEKQNKRLTLQAVVHFKLRVLDLIEVFIREQCQSPLVLTLIMPMLESVRVLPSQKEYKVLKERLEGVILNKLCKLKDCPRLPKFDPATVHDTMNQLFTHAKQSADKRALQLVNGCILLCLRVLIGANGGKTGPSPRKTRAMRKRNAEQAAADAENHVQGVGALDVERMTALYKDAFTDYLTQRHTKLNLIFFTEPVRRFPVLTDTLVHALTPMVGLIKRDFAHTQTFQIIEHVVKIAVANHNDHSVRGVVAAVQPYLESTLRAMLSDVHETADVDGKEESKSGVKGKHVKACVHSVLVMFNATKKFDNNEGLFSPTLSECLDSIAKNTVLSESTPSIARMCLQIVNQMRKSSQEKTDKPSESRKRRKTTKTKA
eukprot:CFRG2139T1